MTYVELAFKMIWNKCRWFSNCPSAGAVAMQSAQAGFPHEALYPVLTATFAGFAQIQEHARSAINSLTGRVGSSNQPKQSYVFDAPI
jgi:hypothetical protein